MPTLIAPAALVEGQMRGPTSVVVRGGRIVEVSEVDVARPRDEGDGVERFTTGFLTAGLVDVQINGSHGVDFGTSTPDAWASARRALLATGVTSIVPTLVTAPIEDLVGSVDAWTTYDDDIADGARVLGLHLEGPFLSPRHPGAHDRAWLRDPDTDAVSTLLAQGRARPIAIVTLAPELPGGLAAVRRLVAAGVVVSIGHSDATSTQVHDAADAGATSVTHLFNAQRGLHHREPGVPGAALADPRLRLGLIADGHHVSDDVTRVVIAAAGDRLVLVTDAVAAAGLPPGRSTLGGEPVEVAGEGQPPRRADGTLAGSTLRLDDAVRRTVALGMPVARALDAVTRTPADLLGRVDVGRIAPGSHGDLVWWDDDLTLRGVWLGGHRVA